MTVPVFPPERHQNHLSYSEQGKQNSAAGCSQCACFIGMVKQTPTSAMTSVQFVLVDLYPVTSNATHHSVSETVFTTRDMTRISYVERILQDVPLYIYSMHTILDNN